MPTYHRRLLVFALVSLLTACGGADRDDASLDAPTGDTGGPDADIGSAEDTDDPSPDSEGDSATDAGDDSRPDTAPDSDVIDSPVDTAPDPPFSLGGRFTLEIDPAEPALRLARDGDTLLVFDGDALSLGVVSRLEELKSYDPVGFALPEDPLFAPPPLDHWTSLVSIAVLDATESGATLALGFDDDRSATLTVRLEDTGRFSLALAVDEPNGEVEGVVAYVRLHPLVDADEAFYGLGEVFDDVNHRGHVRAMQLEIAESESGYNEAHVPVPLVIGTRGWGLFVESFSPGVFDVAAATPNRVDAIFGTGVFTRDGFLFHLYAADHPLDVTRHYYETTGYPARPARWALGPWIWRNENDDQAQVISDVNMIRDLDLATSAYWIDRPYASGVNTFDFHPTQFPGPEAMIAEMHALGFRVALWHTPYLDDSDPATAELRAEAEARGFYPPRSGLLLNNWGRLIDLTNPDAYAWWQSLIQRYAAMGIEGYKLDYGEDIVPGIFGGRSVWSFADGSDDRTMHARFQLFYHRVYAEMLPETGGFLLCRGGTWGDQVNVSVIWPGDLDADLSRHGDLVVEEDGSTYFAVGGLPAALVAGLSLGPSGYPLFGSDTGGYRHSPPDKETFTRWFQTTALSPVMQIGTGGSEVAWEFDEHNGFDDEMLDWYRQYTRLHLRLFPYFWTLFERLYDDGRPIQRALGLAHPELGVHPNDTFMIGEALHVAPVVDRGLREREVWYPDGEWFDWWTGEQRTGPGSLRVDAPLDVLPLSLRGGALVPMLRPTIDTMSPTTAPDRVDSYQTTPGRLYAVVAPGPTTRLTLYDGTMLEQAPVDDARTLTYTPGAEFSHGARFELIATPRPANVQAGDETLLEVELGALDDLEAGWAHAEDDRGGTLHVQVGPTGGTIRIASE